MPDKFVTLDSLSTYKQLEENRTDGLLADKVDKVTTANRLYGTDSNGDQTTYSASLDASLLTEVTWSELKALRDSSQLKPGMLYRITDYVCTTSQSSTSAADHVFDIIVRADDVNALNENASAIQHAGDTYFTNSNLKAWKLQYCLDNDTNRFAWAKTSNGKGVIYRMIDEFGNDCPYDFKNIYTPYFYDGGTLYTNCFTFGWRTANNDSSLAGNCRYNYIAPYHYNTKLTLPLTRVGTGGFYNHLEGHGCILSDSCSYNKAFGFNSQLQIGSNSNYNVVFNSRILPQLNQSVKPRISYNTVYPGGCLYSYSNAGDVEHNIVQANATAYVYRYCNYCIFGSDSSVTISDDYAKNIIVDAGCKSLTLNGNGSASSSNYLQNIHIHFGVTGTVTVDRNLDYSTDVYAAGSQEIILGGNN